MRSLSYRLLLLLPVAVLLIVGSAGCGLERNGTVAARAGVYVALGASDAVGIGATRPASEGWVPRVHSGLPPDTQLVNLGVSGARLRDLIERQLPVALDARPRWVTVWAGVNDVLGEVSEATFAQEIDRLLGQLGQLEGATVVVLNLPDLRLVPIFAQANRERLDATVRARNAAIADAARRHGALLVDLYGGWQELGEHPEYISTDGLHPSRAGYARISELVLAVLRREQALAVFAACRVSRDV